MLTSVISATTNADLHCHSVFSDGTLTPEALALRARQQGVQLWALTDHDVIEGVPSARKAAHAQGMAHLSGVEISVTFIEKTIHIVGLGFDENNAVLLEGLKCTRGGRAERAEEMAAGLTAAGIAGSYEGALRYVGNPDLISRTHFARYLVETGVCSDTSEVFRRFLVEGKPGFVPHRWAKLADALRWIVQAGGIAVLAHPARYGLTANEEYALLLEFKAHGGRGIEVVTGSHTAQDAVRYASVAEEFDLLASRGSDFHGPGEGHVELGQLPSLPGKLRSVWLELVDRITWPDAASMALSPTSSPQSIQARG